MAGFRVLTLVGRSDAKLCDKVAEVSANFCCTLCFRILFWASELALSGYLWPALRTSHVSAALQSRSVGPLIVCRFVRCCCCALLCTVLRVAAQGPHGRGRAAGAGAGVSDPLREQPRSARAVFFPASRSVAQNSCLLHWFPASLMLPS